MELIYNIIIFLFIILVLVYPFLLLASVINPGLLKKVTKKTFSRKKILGFGILFFVVSFVSLPVVGAAIEPESVKQESLGKQKATENKPKPTSNNVIKKAKPTCDGINVKTNCALENINYKTYIYHPAVAEKTHTETVTTYEDKIIGYCTLCNDGTYSPSCATGRGACSHHDGVAQWNAPQHGSVPVESTKTVIDVPAREAFYDKVVE